MARPSGYRPAQPAGEASLAAVRACQGLEVVLPYRISVAELPTILQRHAAWIQERLAWLAARGEAPGQPILPEDIHLPFVGQSFRLVRENAREALLLAGPEELRLCLPETEHGVELVQQWLIGIGKQYLFRFVAKWPQRSACPSDEFRSVIKRAAGKVVPN